MKKIIIVVLSIVFILSASTVGAYLYSASNVTYSNSKLSATNVQQAIEEIYNKSCPSKAICQWKKDWAHVAIGDYVVMTPNPGTLDSQNRYPTDTSKTGYSSVQYIYPKELKLWRVIKKNSDGTVDMVSEYVSSTNVYFSGTTGYANFVGYLNTLADQYKNPTYTKSTRHMGYYPSNPQTSTITDTSYFDETSTKAGTEWTSSTTSTLKQKPSNEALGGGDTLYAYDTEAVQNSLGTLKAKKCNDNTCSKQGTETSYWLASRIYGYNSPTYFNFIGRYVNTGGAIDNYYYLRRYNSRWYSSSNRYAIRPIVTLKSGLTPNDAPGTKDNPFVLS